MTAVAQTVILDKPLGIWKREWKTMFPKCVKEHVKDQPKKMSNATSNEIKRSSISQHLVKNPVCGNSYFLYYKQKFLIFM